MKRTGFAAALGVALVLFFLPAPRAPQPDAPADAPGLVAPEELAAWIVAGDAGYLLVDVRPPSAFAVEAIRGAVSAPAETLHDAALRAFPAHRRLVFYCDTGERSAALAQRVRAVRGDVYVLEGGLRAWGARVLHPQPPAPTAPEAEWAAYRERVALAGHLLGETEGVPAAPQRAVQPVLRPRGPMPAGEGC